MDNLLDDFNYRVSLVDGLTYDEAATRLGGLLEWFESVPQIKSVIDQTIENSQAEAILVPRESLRGGKPPQASSPEQVAGVGLLLLKKLASGTQPLTLGYEFGIKPPRNSNRAQDYYDQIFERYISPSLEFIYRALSQEFPTKVLSKMEPTGSHPLEITESLKHFFRDHPNPAQTAFIMMQFGKTSAHEAILRAIKECLSQFEISALRADDKQYHDDLFPNVQTYMHGCKFGIALFERLESDDFNPNVSLEVGYMRALKKPVCLLKDRTLNALQTDLVGKLYKSFDTQCPETSVPQELTNWLRDKEIIT